MWHSFAHAKSLNIAKVLESLGGLHSQHRLTECPFCGNKDMWIKTPIEVRDANCRIQYYKCKWCCMIWGLKFVNLPEFNHVIYLSGTMCCFCQKQLLVPTLVHYNKNHSRLNLSETEKCSPEPL